MRAAMPSEVRGRVRDPAEEGEDRLVGAPCCSRQVDRQLQVCQREPARRPGRRRRHSCGDEFRQARSSRGRHGRNVLAGGHGDARGAATDAHGVCAAAGAVGRAMRSGRRRHGGGCRHARHIGRLLGRVSRRRHRGNRRCRPADQRVHAEETRDQQPREDDHLQPVPAAAGFVGRGLHARSIPRWRIRPKRRVSPTRNPARVAGIPGRGIRLLSYGTH